MTAGMHRLAQCWMQERVNSSHGQDLCNALRVNRMVVIYITWSSGYLRHQHTMHKLPAQTTVDALHCMWYLQGWQLPAEFSAVKQYYEAVKGTPQWRNVQYGDDLVIAGWKAHMSK